MFSSIFSLEGSITAGEFIVCSVISLVLGIIIALIHCFKNIYSKNIILSLVVLPIVVQTVIMLVNGSIGTGIAVMGAFSLVRFRSQPGNAREISAIFLAMTTGLAMAMGYAGIAALLVTVVGIATVVVAATGFGDSTLGFKSLRVTIPENLDYEGIFDDIFGAYTTRCELIRVKSVNMGSLFELHYHIVMKKGVSEKAFIDAIRCRNGNLTITCGRLSTPKEEL